MNGMLGKKIGMTHLFTEDGRRVCVTAVEAGPCPVVAIKERTVQVGFEAVPEKRLNKPQAGYFKKHSVPAHRLLKEFSKDPSREYKVGEAIKADLFKAGDMVDVSGTSIGKGFQGGMKRWHWHGGGMSHGSTSHRRVGSLGSTTTPGRVWKGHHLPGHMGARSVTVQNLEVVRVDAEKNLLLIKGAVPGSRNAYLVIRKAKKTRVKV